mmetsp:Transcript_1462/g.2246  ORF Transcript_1462/g.2246 Transcript_1462/m.2246 type:complete len:134 (-) Transcript_1462:471-872(-)
MKSAFVLGLAHDFDLILSHTAIILLQDVPAERFVSGPAWLRKATFSVSEMNVDGKKTLVCTFHVTPALWHNERCIYIKIVMVYLSDTIKIPIDQETSQICLAESQELAPHHLSLLSSRALNPAVSYLGHHTLK